MCSSLSIKPTMPMVGVGSTVPAGLSLYKETLPPVTGVPNARQASAMPSTASRSCQKFSGLRIAEIQIVGDSKRSRAGASKIACSLSDGDFAACARMERAIERITIRRRGQDFVSVTNEKHGGV